MVILIATRGRFMKKQKSQPPHPKKVPVADVFSAYFTWIPASRWEYYNSNEAFCSLYLHTKSLCGSLPPPRTGTSSTAQERFDDAAEAWAWWSGAVFTPSCHFWHSWKEPCSVHLSLRHNLRWHFNKANEC